MTDDPAGASRPGRARAIGWSIAFLLLGLLLTALFFFAYSLIRRGAAGAPTFPRSGAEYVISAGCCQLLGFALSTWLIGRRVLGLDAVALRWRGSGSRARGFSWGMALGIVAAVISLVLAVPAGGGWTTDAGSFASYAGRVGLTALALLAPALSEEVAFRGVAMVLLARAFGRGAAIVGLACVFALAHFWNPDSTPVALANIGLAGVLLGVAFYAPGGIWTAFGAHLGWNVALAAADAPVSGLPFQMPFIDHHPGGPWWLTGGTFGPEGGLTATVAIGLATMVALRWTRKEQV